MTDKPFPGLQMRNPDPLCEEHEQALLLLEAICFEFGKFLIPAQDGNHPQEFLERFQAIKRDFKLQRQYVRDMFSYDIEDFRSCIFRPEPPALELKYDVKHLILNAAHL